MTIKDQAEDIIDGIKDRLDGDHCHHHPEHMLAEKAKEKVKELARERITSLGLNPEDYGI